MFGRGAEVLGCYVCSTRASSFLPFLIKFLEASLELCLLLELVFPDLDFLWGVWLFLGGFLSVSFHCLFFRKHIHAEGGFFGGDDKR